MSSASPPENKRRKAAAAAGSQVALSALVASAREKFDLTQPDDQASVLKLAEALLSREEPFEEVLASAVATSSPLEARMAGLLADSRRWLLQRATLKLRVGVVFAMWGEQNRLRPYSTDNPVGEDSLRTKLAQLQWATRGTAIEWHLYAVDDGCPHGSAALARSIAAAHPLSAHVTVLELAKAVPTSVGPLRALRSADDSRKAGAIILGCSAALDAAADVVVYTDADNSVHLGQLGLLLRPHVEEAKNVVIGTRKHPRSVLVKEAARWGVGIKVLRHMQRMIGHAIFSRGIKDTQAAFKLYDRATLTSILEEPTVYDFSFDTDWILAAIKRDASLVQVPFAFIDSAAESASIAQGPMTTWEALLFGLIKAVRRHGYLHHDAAAMAALVEEKIKGAADLEKIIDKLPVQLEKAGEAEYGDAKVMSVDELSVWLDSALLKE